MRAALVALMLLALPAKAEQRVALELVLAVDVSTSIDASEFRLQRIGLVRAFRHPGVRAAILSQGDAGIAVAVVQWAGKGRQRPAVDWMFLDDEPAIRRLSNRIGAMSRLTGGFTDIAGAVRFSTQWIETNAFEGERKVIDVSGDGVADQGDPPAARDAAVALGIVVNGLVIDPQEYDLGALAADALFRHYERDVTGGPGSFVLKAAGFEDFTRAIREKLIREITGPAFVEVAPRLHAFRAQAPASMSQGNPTGIRPQ